MTYGVLLTVAYDGTDFEGWQSQPGRRTVQGVLEDAIAKMAGAAVRVRGASRTDAGVHAEGQRAAFDVDRTIATYGWAQGLNAALPPDVAVQNAEECAVGYDPRFDAVSKTYRYVLRVAAFRDPATRHRAWWIGPQLARSGAAPASRGEAIEEWLDVGAMRSAASCFAGTHDFRAFRSADDERERTVRTMREVRVDVGFAGDPKQIAIVVTGDAFMKQMVRILAGTLVDVGRGRIDAEQIPSLLGERARREDAGQTAPPHGLTLVQIVLGRRPAGG